MIFVGFLEFGCVQLRAMARYMLLPRQLYLLVTCVPAVTLQCVTTGPEPA